MAERLEPIMFNASELGIVGEAVMQAEELVSNFYKLSSSQWLNNRYDVKTARDLEPHEQVGGAYAQVLKYEGRRGEIFLGSTAFSLYHVCLQDSVILTRVACEPRLRLSPFLLYIVVHELVHVVRFLRFEHRYEAASEADLSLEEERRVHGLTRKILKGIQVGGLDQVVEFYGKW